MSGPNAFTSQSSSLTNYIAYQDAQGQKRVGHYELSANTIQPLAFISGTYIRNLYEVIEAGESNIIASGDPISASSVKILAPLTGRDVLCVGKNYAEHAKEFNSSGFDSSDKVDVPSAPVIFTKRFTSIIADGEDVYVHPEFSKTVDYEGEIGVIIGKSGFRIAEEDAMDHVWGYTIINDMTARERQRDHKQFYLGKSPDTFCPMGPIAVPAQYLDKTLHIQTFINGELRQNATTKDLIFSIPHLIKTLSEAQTLVPGDVLATGTPAGVGIGLNPPTYLTPGDTVQIRVSGLGTLTNRISPSHTPYHPASPLRSTNTSRTAPNPSLLTPINNKPLHYYTLGPQSAPPILFIHGLASSSSSFHPLVQKLHLDKTHALHLFDIPGHGLSPLSPLHCLSTSSLADDVAGICTHAGLTQRKITIVAHGLGCLAALEYYAGNAESVSRVVLIDFPDVSRAEQEKFKARAQIVRQCGMSAVVDDIIREEVGDGEVLVGGMVRMAVMAMEPEGYAGGCEVFSDVQVKGWEGGEWGTEVVVVTGGEGEGRVKEVLGEAVERGDIKFEVLEGGGRGMWSLFERLHGVVEVLGRWI